MVVITQWAMSTSQRAATPCGWGVKVGMVRVWVAGKTVWSSCYTRARDKELIIKRYINSPSFTFYFTPIEPRLLLLLMSSVSVSFRSARAAANDNETGYRRQYMQRPTSPPRNSTAFGTWSAGKELDALSKLVTGGIFHVQKIAICW